METRVLTRFDKALWSGLYPNYPFQECWYTRFFIHSFSADPVFVIYGDGNHNQVLFPFEKIDNTVLFMGMKKVLGGQELTDYGDIVTDISDIKKLYIIIRAMFPHLIQMKIKTVVLDYVREDSLLYQTLHAFPGGSIQKQEVAPYILLPDSWDKYLETLPRIERKELRRKLRRLDTVTHSFDVYDTPDETIFNDFIRLHRLSDKNKEKFMSPSMEIFFRGLVFSDEGTWKRKFAVLSIFGKPAVIILFFEQKNRVLLYNSGFDPELGYYSSGLMTHALLIKRNIEKGVRIHDFLRGSERYKYDLGAQDINLYKISINL